MVNFFAEIYRLRLIILKLLLLRLLRLLRLVRLIIPLNLKGGQMLGLNQKSENIDISLVCLE